MLYDEKQTQQCFVFPKVNASYGSGWGLQNCNKNKNEIENSDFTEPYGWSLLVEGIHHRFMPVQQSGEKIHCQQFCYMM